PKYINDAAIGSKYWDIATFSSNKYLQMSAYNAGCSKTYFIIPVDFTKANQFLFKSKDGYNDGNPLKVYYTSDYAPGNNVDQAILIDITSKFKISAGNNDGYGAEFVNSGIYAIPNSLSGNGYFIFEYNGTTGITTTMQLDDIVVR
ncbi:choice-of-anchor J domain-containing protein, partial [Flavobacterium sp.]|uniref:choice-of-anchor J domain-containing protein n=1 Tax=Flavobacterium sp. TaxID=239 RepID=UPI0038FCDA03